VACHVAKTCDADFLVRRLSTNYYSNESTERKNGQKLNFHYVIEFCYTKC
jgi:hypothetical protein